MEGQSNSKPPYFDGKEYDVWKNKMKAFLRSRDPLQWDVVERGINPTAASTSNKNGKDKESKPPLLCLGRSCPKEKLLMQKSFILYIALCLLLNITESLHVKQQKKFGIDFMLYMKGLIV